MKQSNILKKKENTKRQPSEEQAKEAVKTLISWAGDDPEREGLLDTPKRVIIFGSISFIQKSSK